MYFYTEITHLFKEIREIAIEGVYLVFCQNNKSANDAFFKAKNIESLSFFIKDSDLIDKTH